MMMNSTGSALKTAIRKWSLPILAFAAALGLAICCTNAIAQTQSGLSTIQGTVADSTGAVMRGATVRIVNKATQAASEAKTNDVGFYQAPGLIAGTYSVTVKAPNMKTNVYTVELLATQTAVVNPVMTAGAVTEQVTVSASIVQLTDTTSGAITSTLDNQQIDHIPMNSRNIASQVMVTTPGLEYGFGGSAGQGSNPGTRMNGLVGEALEYDEDGAPTANRQFGGPNVSGQAQYEDPDSVQEVRVVASGGGAEYATPGTAIISTKSGTNQIHGSAFWTGRNNSAAGIAKARQNAYNFAVPNYKRNEYGVSAGGPVIIPWLYHGKDKTFWFVAYEKYDYIYSTNYIASTETTGMPNGDFSGLTQTLLYDPSTTAPNAACPTPGTVNGVTKWNTGTPVNNPYCRTPFGTGIEGDPGNNQIPLARRNGVAKIVYDMQIPPNISGITNPRLQANENWLAPNQYFIPTVTWRLDHNFNENNKAYLRYTSNLQTDQYYGGQIGTIAADGIPALALGSETIAPYTNFVGAAGYTHVFSPSFFSETIVSGNWAAQPVTATGNTKRDYQAELGLPNSFGETGMPNISGSIQSHNGNMFDYGLNDNIWTGDENLTKTLREHQLLFGARYRHEWLHYQPDESSDSEAATAQSTGLEQPSTGTSYGAYSGTGDSAADYFLGSFATMSVNILEKDIPFSSEEFDAYIQDNWHVRRNLTLNLGLRWEDHPAMDSAGVGVGTDFVNHAVVLENTPAWYIAHGYTTQSIITAYQNAGANYETPQQAGFPSKMMRDYPLNFDPRVGFAWQPFGTKRGTVLSGSYGIYSFPEAIRNLLGLARAAPFVASFSYNNNLNSQNPDGISNYEIRHAQNIFLGTNTPSSIVPTTGTNFVNPGAIGGGYNPNFPPTRVQEVNVSIEQSFKDQSALRVTYNYTHASNLTHQFSINQGATAFVWAYDTGTTPPTGGTSAIGTCQYQTTALEPWDCKWFGGTAYQERNGWSNDNSLQASYQRRFHHGFGYQVNYVWSRPFRAGGNSTRDSLTYPIQDYPGQNPNWTGGSNVTYAPPAGGSPITMPIAPPPLPHGAVSWADYHALTRFEDYKIEPYYGTYFHHITINGIYDLPVGHGKWLLGNANRLVDELVGGWQIAGIGQVESQEFAPAASNWGPTSSIKTYKRSVPIQDCSAGAGTSKCFNRFMWFNGYISPKLLPASNGGTCVVGVSNPGCVTGLPTSYVPYETPINNDPNFPTNFGNNNVVMSAPTLNGGNPYTVAFAPDPSQGYAGNNRFNRSIIHGPFNYETDLSVYKVFPIREKMDFRVNVDAFNALNIQGYNNPNTTSGEESVSPGGIDGSSFWAPRQLQLTMRFSW